MRMLQRAETRARGFDWAAYLRNFDWVLLLSTLGIVAFGLCAIYSATHGDANAPSPAYYVQLQLRGLVVGLIGLLAASLIDFSLLARLKRPLYALAIVLLVLTLAVGLERMGGKRWLPLGFFDLQTSELAKILVAVSFAAFLADGAELRSRFRFVILGVVYVAVPALLVFLEPDLGTALVFFFMLVSMLVVWGIKWTHLGILALGAVVAIVAVVRVLPAIGLSLLKPYQLQRLLVFLNPEQDISAAGYQLSQSKIAVASGMFTGKGYMQGTQTGLNYLPQHHTDFIFSAIAEELGFLGVALLLGLYLVTIWRAFRIASESKSMFGSLIAAGIIGILVFQIFVNVGMTIGIMPITGVPLPFVSFGSSSLMVFLVAIGLLESVRVHSRTSLYGSRLKGEPYGQVAT